MSTNLINIEEFEKGFKVITFSRPDALNALNSDLLTELNNILEGFLAEENGPCGIILTGEGEKAFVAGADIKSMVGISREEAKSFSLLGQQTTLLLESLQCPVISCVNGFALGGGLEMALAGDFMYASKNAIFGLPEVKLGLIPGFGGTQRLERVVGRNMARELIFTGKNLTADEAAKVGLVNEVFGDKEAMIEAAKKTLKLISKNSLYAVGKSKEAILRGADGSLMDGLKLEALIFSEIFDSHDAKEGTLAFTEKRKPNFKHQSLQE